MCNTCMCKCINYVGTCTCIYLHVYACIYIHVHVGMLQLCILCNVYTCTYMYVYTRRSNFLGTSFTVYDSGLNPSRRQSRHHQSSIREEMAFIHYVRTCMHMYVHVHAVHTCTCM